MSSSFLDFTLKSIGQIPSRVGRCLVPTRIIEKVSAALLDWALLQDNWEIIMAVFITYPESLLFVIKDMRVSSLLFQSTPKLGSLKQHPFVSSQFLWMRNPAPLSGVLCSRVSLTRAQLRRQSRLGSHLKARVRQDPPPSSCDCWQNSFPSPTLKKNFFCSFIEV